MLDKYELLAPAGDIKKFETALHFGCDAIYCAGKKFGLRAHSKNFEEDDILNIVEKVHSLNKKIYITANIYANNNDFNELGNYLKFLEKAKVDAIIVSDPGIIAFAKETAPNLPLHLSTQANATNKYAVKFWSQMGIERVVLAREAGLDEIKEIKDLAPEIEIEAFVHGAMCMAYSGRCLLSNFLTERNANHGDCSQVCRWEWQLKQKNRDTQALEIEEDERGTYIMNSKDLNMIEHLGKLMKLGVNSFKIEGRMKTQYYVACVINAYRMAIDYFKENGLDSILDKSISDELFKISHREYTTGFYFGHPKKSISIDSSQTKSDYDFVAEVLSYDDTNSLLEIEQRNRFKIGDKLEILSNNKNLFNKSIIIGKIYNRKGEEIEDAKNVQEKLYIPCPYKLNKNDILRKSQNG